MCVCVCTRMRIFERRKEEGEEEEGSRGEILNTA